MMDTQQLRSILIKLESRLNVDDRERLPFSLGNDVPRRIPDDAWLRGTLRLLNSLFDQDKINEQDFTFLIHALEQIQCLDAVRLLKEHTREMLSQSIQSLVSIMPGTFEQLMEAQELDKYAFHQVLLDSLNGTKVTPTTANIDNHSLKSTQKQIPERPLTKLKNRFLCTFILSFSGLILRTGFIIYHTITVNRTKQKSLADLGNLNERIRYLESLRAGDQRRIHILTDQLNRSLTLTHINQIWKQNAATQINSNFRMGCLSEMIKRSTSLTQMIIVLWNGSSGEILIANIECWNLKMDADRSLYVSDLGQRSIRRWKTGESFGRIVAGGNGRGDRLGQLDEPYNFFIDDEHSVYVSDKDNHRVSKWRKGEKEEKIVVGGNEQGQQANQLFQPIDLALDREKNLYVLDHLNNRLQRFEVNQYENIER